MVGAKVSFCPSVEEISVLDVPPPRASHIAPANLLQTSPEGFAVETRVAEPFGGRFSGGVPGPNGGPVIEHEPSSIDSALVTLVPAEFRTPVLGANASSDHANVRSQPAPPHSDSHDRATRLVGGFGAAPSSPEEVAAATNSQSVRDGNHAREISAQEQGLLVKLFASVVLVNFSDIQSSTKCARIQLWKRTIRQRLAATRPIVVEWWDSLWELTEPLHRQWSMALPAHRSQYRCPGAVPPHFAWIDNFWRSRLLETLPKRVQSKAKDAEQFGPTLSCAQCLYLLLQDQGPGDLHDIDETTQHLRSPAVCTDPAAAQMEMRRWWASLQRAQALRIALPDIRELYRACLSIFKEVFSAHADPEVQHRWLDMLSRTGGNRVQTWDALKQLQDHAVSELEFLVTSGQRGSSTALPLTETQKQRKRQDEARAKAAIAAAAGAQGGRSFGVANATESGAKDRVKSKVVKSNVHNPDKAPCRSWQNGECKHGRKCAFRHDSISSHDAQGNLIKRCFVCGGMGHLSRECVCPGGGKRTSEGPEPRPKGKGKGSKSKQEKPPHVAASTVESNGFPDGATGIDSGANVYLTHGAEPGVGKFKNSTLTLANGSAIRCRIGLGRKGIPQAVVVGGKGSALDLLPVDWLCNRGCSIVFGLSPSLTTPQGRVLHLGKHNGLAFATKDQLEIIFCDLPEASAPGIDGKPAAKRVVGDTLVLSVASLSGAGSGGVQPLPSSSLRTILDQQELEDEKVSRLLRGYRQMPDEYSKSDMVPPSVADFGRPAYLQHLGLSPGVPAALWEWCAGSGRLSSTARSFFAGSPAGALPSTMRPRTPGGQVLHPLDHRWGHDLNNPTSQVNLLWSLIYYGTSCLFVSPTCTPWSANSRSWPERQRRRRRAEESLLLGFVALACLVQALLGRGFVVENPEQSDIWHEDSMSLLAGDWCAKHSCDQCMYGTMDDQTFARKSTSFLSNVSLSDVMHRCNHSHAHQPLVGGARTARSAVYSTALCEQLLTAIMQNPCAAVGGRLAFTGSPRGHHLNEIVYAFDDLRVIAVSRGLQAVWDRLAKPWFQAAFNESADKYAENAVGRMRRSCQLMIVNDVAAHAAQFVTDSSNCPSMLARTNEVVPAAQQSMDQSVPVSRGIVDDDTAAGKDSQSKFRPPPGLDEPVVPIGCVSHLCDTVLNELRELKTQLAEQKLSSENVISKLASANVAGLGDHEFVPLACSGDAVPEEPAAPPVGAEPPAPVAADDAIFESKVTCKLTDLLRGDLAPHTWQYKQYESESATWLAAGQRRHMHRRRLNTMTSVASVDLSGPHDPTPMPGHRHGKKFARYYLVLSIRPDSGHGHHDVECQTEMGPPSADGDVAAPGHVKQESSDSRSPLIYCALLEKKSDATSAIMLLMARVRSDLGYLPNSFPHRLHSDMGGEFMNQALTDYCNFHGIRKSHTGGYDPSANGAGESAVGFIKRKSRQLLVGSGLTTHWWGMAALCAASYSRCAAELEDWPALPFGVRAMLVKDPPERNAFLPRSLPCTLFGPADEVSGGYYAYHYGVVRQATNVKWSPLKLEELSYIKAHIGNWGVPEAPCQPLPSSSWNAGEIGADNPPDLADVRVQPPEAPLAEELPPPVRDLGNDRTVESSDSDEEPTPAETQAFGASAPQGLMNEGRSCGVTAAATSDAAGKLQEHSHLVSRRAHARRSRENFAAHAHAYISTTSSVEVEDGSAVSVSSTEIGSQLEYGGDSLEFEDSDEFRLSTSMPSWGSVPGSGERGFGVADTADLPVDEDSEKAREYRRLVLKNFESKALCSSSRMFLLQKGFKTWSSQLSIARACRVGLNSMELQDDDLLDGPLPADPLNIVDDPTARPVTDREVHESTGPTRQKWVAAAEAEYQDSFLRMSAIEESSCSDIEAVGGHRGALPMKVVWCVKSGGRYKCRAVVCGNFATKDPTEQVWTAQAETASVMCALRLSVLRGWQVSKVDVKGAFMYAPLPQDTHVVVRAPQSWAKLGIVRPNTFWTLRRAVYGLRCSPKAWGDERDRQFRGLTWSLDDVVYAMVQCVNDSQVWRVVKGKVESPDSFVGLVLAYVDDLLLLLPGERLRVAFNDALRKLWKLSSEQVLDGSAPFIFLGLELQRKPCGDLLLHQGSFVKQILRSYGLDSTCKPIHAVSVPMPSSDEIPPTPEELKALQKYAGEFNWLATRTRPDLAYFTSLIASSMKAYGAWTLNLCRKVLRYLVGTVEQGLVMKCLSSNHKPSLVGSNPEGVSGSIENSEPQEVWDPQQMIIYSDAGFGGVGTRAQTGVLVLWAGSPVLARSSRQSVSALSTCEAEVCAASTAWVCTEGLSCLLEEWHVELKPAILLVDNKSALTLMRLGGSWRTRYFAVRAVRIIEESSAGKLELRYCPTKVMGADALTKLATGEVMSDFRNLLHSIPFDVPGAGAEFKLSDGPVVASAVLATSSVYGTLPMIERRRQANQLAFEIVSSCPVVTDAQLQRVLLLWGFAKNRSRRNVAPPGSSYVHSECFGLVYDRTGRWVMSTVARMFPHVASLLNRWVTTRLSQLRHKSFDDPCVQWRWSSITVNRGYCVNRHVDLNNFGPSIIRSIAVGDGPLRYWPEGTRGNMSTLLVEDAVELPIARSDRLVVFDGTRPHETGQHKGDVSKRLSIVFFQSARGWHAPAHVTEELSNLGFMPAASEDDAADFANRFELLSYGGSYASWKLQHPKSSPAMEDSD